MLNLYANFKKNTKMKYKIWLLLEKLDDLINHGLFEHIFDLFPVENKDGSDHWSYKLWLKTSRRFCNFIVIDLYDKWFPDKENK